MHPFIEELYATGTVASASGGTRDLEEASVPRADGEVLYELARRVPEGATTLETGMAFGLSTLFICAAHEARGGGQHLAIDPYQSSHWESIGELNLERAGLAGRCTVLSDRSSLVLPQLLREGKELDLAFIDGDHRFEGALLDWFYCDRMLRPGGYLALHDLWLPSTRKAVTFILTHHGDCYEPAAEFMDRPAGLWAGCARAAADLFRNPLEPATARMFARKRFRNLIVLRKTRHRSESEYDQAWNFYRPF